MLSIRRKEHGIASSKKHFAFLVRRARLLLGETQNEFAYRFGVETSTVSRWERGLVKPLPKAQAEITKIALKTDPFRSEDIIRASPAFKYVAAMNNLTAPRVVSEGLAANLVALGYTIEDFLKGHDKRLWAGPDDPIYEISVAHCLKAIEKDPRWLSGEIYYAEFGGFTKARNAWALGLVAPLPDTDDNVALVEAVVAEAPSEGPFIRLVTVHS
jgi:transcriptional regulator with XRE-family HTH domain